MAARRPNSLFTASSRVFLPSLGSCARVVCRTASLLPPHLCRNVHIKATPSTSSVEGPVDLSEQTQAIPKLSGGGPFPADVRFEVLGAPYSLLSVALPASSLLYSRRGTLVGINGKTENAVSTLSILEPFRRAALRIPFLYQKISSTSPLTCLISTNTPNTTFGVIELDGKVDWMLTQHDALLAWTGHSISSRPTISHKMSKSLAHWGNSKLTGRGLVALIGRGQIYQVTLNPGEEFVVHPSSLLAYSMNGPSRPAPYRLRSTSLRLQVPSFGLSRFMPEVEALRKLRNSEVYRAAARMLFTVRTWSRRAVWGDRLFLRFRGPTTILMQSRTVRLAEVFRKNDFSELADTEPGALPEMGQDQKNIVIGSVDERQITTGSSRSPKALKVAIVRDGKLEFQDSDFKAFTRS
ncbi:Altered inheritance of mitochondria protein 24, mitochondrial [Maublancomyces gigas]|uniref:Altered inheritance of mitochondria protein 24, mitochondrial n=1 Tax=Discina gigas TaxID=1032678 RepID=A0ABR3GF44_9PEZI